MLKRRMITVLGSSGTPPVLVTIAMPNALTNVPYSVDIEADGATHWALLSGTPPTGLTLNSATGAVNGSATVGGATSSFVVKISNAYGSITVALSIEVDWSSFRDLIMGDVAAGYAPIAYFPDEVSGAIINHGSAGSNADLTVVGTPTRRQDGPLGTATATDFPGSASVYAIKSGITATVLPRTTWILIYKPRTMGASSAGEMVAQFGGSNGQYSFNSSDNAVRARIQSVAGTNALTQATITSHLNNWHLVFFTFDDNGDRKLHGYRAIAGTVSEFTTNMTAGTGVMNDLGFIRMAYRFDGLINAYAVENRVLTVEQMQEMHNLVFGVGAAETYSLTPLLIDGAFSRAGLGATAQGHYDDMWTAINDANEYPAPDTIATFSNYSYNPAVPETSYEYGIGYALRYILSAYYLAFIRTGERALFDEIRRIMALVTPADIENISTLYESMLEGTIALHMLMLYANRSDGTSGATYTSEFNTWRDALLARIALRGAIVNSSLAHSHASAMFTAFALYMCTGTLSYLWTAKSLRDTFQSECTALSHDGRVVWYHRMPRSASPNDHYPQPTNYADYTIAYLMLLHEAGFNWYHGMSGFDQTDLVNTLLNMTASGNTCTGDMDGGDGTISPDVWAIRTLAAVAKDDGSGVLATRAATIRALSSYPARRPAVPACLLYASP